MIRTGNSLKASKFKATEEVKLSGGLCRKTICVGASGEA